MDKLVWITLAVDLVWSGYLVYRSSLIQRVLRAITKHHDQIIQRITQVKQLQAKYQTRYDLLKDILTPEQRKELKSKYSAQTPGDPKPWLS